MSDMHAFVYGLFAPDRDVPFYVGSTKYDPAARLKAHLQDVECGRHVNTQLARVVRAEGIDNIRLEILETVPIERRWHVERDWIHRFLAQGIELTNRVFNGLNYEIADQCFEYGERTLVLTDIQYGVGLWFAMSDSDDDVDPFVRIAGATGVPLQTLRTWRDTEAFISGMSSVNAVNVAHPLVGMLRDEIVALQKNLFLKFGQHDELLQVMHGPDE